MTKSARLWFAKQGDLHKKGVRHFEGNWIEET